MPSRRSFLIAVSLATAVGCGSKKARVKIPDPIPARVGARETGIASWYGRPYHGRRTSSGEIYDMNRLTAAHLRLPFGTLLRVTNLSNNRSVEVRVNDRGPFIDNRVIDLSREAARRIEMIGPGTARVRLEVIAAPGERPAAEPPSEVAAAARLNPPPCVEGPYYAVQVGAFEDRENAERMRGKTAAKFGEARVDEIEVDGRGLYRVAVGRFPDAAGAESLLRRLAEDRYDGFVRRIEPMGPCPEATAS